VNGMDFADSKQVVALLEGLKERPAFFCELAGESGYNLLVAIGGDIGCTQYSRGDGNPPYWMATSSATKAEEGYADFLMADTAAPMPMRYCLPFDAVKDIVVYFQNTGLRNPAVNWEEI
jgi:Immunity protein Imm1